MSQKTLLIITDGIGHNQKEEFNAFKKALKPTYDWLFKNIPHSLIHTYGHYVGLPENQMGNSEVGHMTLGSGQIIYQDLAKISNSIKNQELQKSPILKNFFSSSKAIHIAGLISDGGVHSHINHFLTLIKIAQKEDKEIFLHLIADGRDVLPQSAEAFIIDVLKLCNEKTKIATISGRFYAMDRDQRWERIQEAYDCIHSGQNKTNLGIREYLKFSYSQGIYDEFIKPASFDDYTGLNDNDGFLFINFRSDRSREIILALDQDSLVVSKKSPKKINILTMTSYDKTFQYPVLFPKKDLKNTLGSIISDAGLSQVRIAETEKYAHVTFFFNGGIEEPYLGETRILVPSPKVKTYDEIPQMSAFEVTEGVLKSMDERTDFIVVNFANGDMVGHTGNFEAAIKAVESVDTCLGQIFQKAQELNYAVILTSDHGNCEEMKNDQGEILTNHTVGDVWCFVMANGVSSVSSGTLANIAPSVLKIMGIEIPEEMQQPLF